MNYFGHAAVASWIDSSPGAVLGAMLPDFASMSRIRLAEPSDPEIARGIEMHHQADRAFHQLPVVLGLMRELDGALDAAGVARGPRRAVAHIGVELLLDGVLVDDASYRDAYLGALAHDPAGVQFQDEGDAARFATLHARLRSYGVPDDLREPDSIVHRLHRILAHRPLLAPSPADLVGIRASLVAFKPRIEVATSTVLRAIRAAVVTTP